MSCDEQGSIAVTTSVDAVASNLPKLRLAEVITSEDHLRWCAGRLVVAPEEILTSSMPPGPKIIIEHTVRTPYG
jgi:hypothetical protein